MNPEIMMVIYCMLALPFVAIGAVVAFKHIIRIIKVRKGYYKVVFRLANYRTKIQYLKPKATTIETKEGATKQFTKDPGYVYFDGNTPVIEYDDLGSQIDFGATKKDQDPEDLDSLLKRTYNLGQRMGREKDEKMIKIMMLTAGICGITLVVLLMIVGGFWEVGSLAAK